MERAFMLNSSFSMAFVEANAAGLENDKTQKRIDTTITS